VGHRYIIGGDSLPLGQVLALMAAASRRRKFFIPVPGLFAQLAASIIEFKADHLTRRQPAATVEGVRIARAATALSIEKARRELGYAPRSIEPVLHETIAHMLGTPLSKVLKYA
jgi:dihydroflavonol-4-reductase